MNIFVLSGVDDEMYNSEDERRRLVNPAISDKTMVLETNPLYDISRVQARSVTFRMEEYKESKIEESESNQRKILKYTRSFFCPDIANNLFPSRKTLLLLRGSSISLVELPTFLPSSCTVQIRCPCRNTETPSAESGLSLAEVLANYQPRNQTTGGDKSQWTVMIVAISFFTTCLLMVGVMLSITSEYQDITIARVLKTYNVSTVRYVK